MKWSRFIAFSRTLSLVGVLATPVHSLSPSKGVPSIRRPTTMPTSAPAARRTSTRPATQPSFTPLANARPGQWALYTALGNRELRYEIRKISGAGVTTEVTIKQGGKPLGLPALREDPSDYDPLPLREGAQRRISPTTLQVAGRSWKAQLFEDRWTDEKIHYVRRTWVSPDAPVFGTLKMELHGDGELEARLQLTAYGLGPPTQR